MQLFYSENISGSYAIIEDQELIHCTKVLRKSMGDTIHLLDGKGKLYECILIEANKKVGKLEIVKILKEQKELAPLPSIAVGVIKNNARMEWLLEKATEIGVSTIYPLICQRSERTNMNMDRMEKILISAMKQSIRLYKPVLMEPMKFADFIASAITGSKLIAHYDEANKSLGSKNNNSLGTTILIGPEGDFTDEEINLARISNYEMVNLGDSRLRTETAAMVALALLNNKS
jgi:16S rRNA (uracil1498-N3)-methyltransferase